MTLSDYEHDSIADYESGLLGLRGMLWPVHTPRSVHLTADEVFLGYSTDHRSLEQRDPRGMLDAFVRIEAAQDVERFARKFGPLALCKHGVTYTHSYPRVGYVNLIRPTLPRGRLKLCEPRPADGDQLNDLVGLASNDEPSRWRLESIDDWLVLAKKCRAFLRLASAIAKDPETRPTDKRKDWYEIVDRPHCDVADDATGPSKAIESKAQKNNRLRMFALTWLHLSDLSISYDWDEKNTPGIGWATRSAWGQIGIQLMSVHIGWHGLLICIYCQMPFRAGRKRKAGERTVCQEQPCRRAHERDRKRTQRLRK